MPHLAPPPPAPPPSPLQLTILPPVHELQRDADTRWRWVNYSAFDAKSTWDLYQRLRHELMAMGAALDEAVEKDYAQVGALVAMQGARGGLTWADRRSRYGQSHGQG